MFDAFESRNTKVIAIAQEDTDLESHGRFLQRFEQAPPFEIVADLNRAKTTAYDRTTIYIVDKDKVVRQVIPNTVYYRAAWETVLNEIDRIQN